MENKKAKSPLFYYVQEKAPKRTGSGMGIEGKKGKICTIWKKCIKITEKWKENCTK